MDNPSIILCIFTVWPARSCVRCAKASASAGLSSRYQAAKIASLSLKRAHAVQLSFTAGASQRSKRRATSATSRRTFPLMWRPKSPELTAVVVVVAVWWPIPNLPAVARLRNPFHRSAAQLLRLRGRRQHPPMRRPGSGGVSTAAPTCRGSAGPAHGRKAPPVLGRPVFAPTKPEHEATDLGPPNSERHTSQAIGLGCARSIFDKAGSIDGAIDFLKWRDDFRSHKRTDCSARRYRPENASGLSLRA